MNFQNFGGQWVGGPLGSALFLGVGGLVLFLLILWSIFWKGLALWKAAHEGSRIWFVVLLVVNTAGILEILYLYVFSKRSAALKP
jgi:hypothetical protein